jgi:hypothetical protein
LACVLSGIFLQKGLDRIQVICPTSGFVAVFTVIPGLAKREPVMTEEEVNCGLESGAGFASLYRSPEELS